MYLNESPANAIVSSVLKVIALTVLYSYIPPEQIYMPKPENATTSSKAAQVKTRVVHGFLVKKPQAANKYRKEQTKLAMTTKST